MPPRIFEPRRVRLERLAAELTQEEAGALMGVSGVAVGNWESGKKTPDPEKLPALARVLQRDLDDLFPREGPPDLADLRCDAGYAQYRTTDIIGTRSAAPVSKAERGLRRLDPQYVPLLATAYGVSVDALLAAQERSFGRGAEGAAERFSGPTAVAAKPVAPQSQAQPQPQPQPETEPETAPSGVASDIPSSLSGRIAYLDDHLRGQGQLPPDDAEIARTVNERAGAVVVSAADVRDLRDGAPLRRAMPPVLIDGLAQAFGVVPQFFQPDQEAVREMAAGLQMLALLRSGRIGAVAARSGDGEPSPELVQFVDGLLDDIDAGKLPGTGGTGADLD